MADAGADKLYEKASDLLFVTVPLSIVYFGGIIYISSYLQRFSISVLDVDLSIPIVLSYSFNVFLDYYFVVPVILTVLLYFVFGYCLGLRRFKDVRERLGRFFASRINAALFGLVVLFLVFVVVRYAAQDAAGLAAEDVFAGNTASIYFSAMPEPSELSLGTQQKAVYRACLDSAAMHYVFSTADATYAICPVKHVFLIIGQKNSDGRTIPLRVIRHETST